MDGQERGVVRAPVESHHPLFPRPRFADGGAVGGPWEDPAAGFTTYPGVNPARAESGPVSSGRAWVLLVGYGASSRDLSWAAGPVVAVFRGVSGAWLSVICPVTVMPGLMACLVLDRRSARSRWSLSAESCGIIAFTRPRTKEAATTTITSHGGRLARRPSRPTGIPTIMGPGDLMRHRGGEGNGEVESSASYILLDLCAEAVKSSLDGPCADPESLADFGEREVFQHQQHDRLDHWWCHCCQAVDQVAIFHCVHHRVGNGIWGFLICHRGAGSRPLGVLFPP